MKKLIVRTPAFEHEGKIPVEYTGYGPDISPEFNLQDIAKNAKSIAIIMDDLGHPIPGYNHWVIWNIPLMQTIPANIPHGKLSKAYPAQCRDADTESTDTEGLTRHLTGPIDTNSVFIHWTVL